MASAVTVITIVLVILLAIAIAIAIARMAAMHAIWGGSRSAEQTQIKLAYLVKPTTGPPYFPENWTKNLPEGDIGSLIKKLFNNRKLKQPTNLADWASVVQALYRLKKLDYLVRGEVVHLGNTVIRYNQENNRFKDITQDVILNNRGEFVASSYATIEPLVDRISKTKWYDNDASAAVGRVKSVLGAVQLFSDRYRSGQPNPFNELNPRTGKNLAQLVAEFDEVDSEARAAAAVRVEAAEARAAAAEARAATGEAHPPFHKKSFGEKRARRTRIKYERTARDQYVPAPIPDARQVLGYSDRTFANPLWRLVDGLPVAELNSPRRVPGPVSRVVMARTVSVADADVSVGDAWPRARDARARVDVAGLSQVPTLVFVPAAPKRGPAVTGSFASDLRGAEHVLAATNRLNTQPGTKIPPGTPGYLFSFSGSMPLEFVGWYPGT